MFNLRLPAAALCAAVAFSVPALADSTVVVTSPTGLFTNPGPTNATGPGGPAYDTWYADNVRNGGAAGITNTYADHGNGSIQFTGGTNAKADFEFNPSTPFSLRNLTALSYDYYRSSSSTVDAWLDPAFRVYVSDGQGHSGNLVFETVYNGQQTSPTDQFVTANILNSYFWNSSTSFDPTNSNPDFNRTLADWLALYPGLQVYQFTVGIGSGWTGSFNGAADNISIGVNGVTTTYNFETPSAAATPEPGSLALLATGTTAMAGLWKRRRQTVR